MTTRTYNTKPLAIEAARTALKAAGIKDPMSAVHFALTQEGEEWAWHEMNVTSGETATGERIADGAVQGKPVPVTVIPPKGSKPAAAKKTAPKAKPPVKVSPREQRRLDKIAAATVNAAAKKAAAAAKAAAPKAPKGPSTTTRKAVALTSAQTGKLPAKLDFSKPTHARYRKLLAELEGYVAKGDVRKLKTAVVNPVSSSRVMLNNWRNLCVVALEAKAKGAKAPAIKKAA